jgi:ribokinase
MAQIEAAIGRAAPGDWLLLQNETNLVPEAARAARAAGLNVAYAAAPFDAAATGEMLPLADLIAVNEVEAAQLAAYVGRAVDDLGVPALLVTLGRRGAVYRADGAAIETPAFEVTAVDTTGAGDTFFGFFLAGLDLGEEPAAVLRRAAAAGALQVTKPGAGDAIPSGAEVDRFLAGHG